MKIRPIVSGDPEFADWYDVYRRACLVDYPHGPTWLQRELAVRTESTPWFESRLWIAEDGDVAVGAAWLALPLTDNLERADIEVYVPPEARRGGIGSALLAELIAGARAAGRRNVQSWLEGPTTADTTSGTAFATRHGFTPRLREVARVQRPPFALDMIAGLEAQAEPHAADYRLVQWRDQVPAEYVDEYARMNQRMSTDPPIGDLAFEEETWDAARIRASEDRSARMGRTRFATAAIAPDGSMAGATEIVVATDSDETAFQDLTIVDPRHRGHRLGLLLKAANLRYLLASRPGIARIWTWNADSNSFMISVNESIGYRVEGWGAGYQLDLDEV